MRTFLQMLRIGFWMLPLQRGLTVIGAVVLICGQMFRPSFGMPGPTLPITLLGWSLMVVVPLLAGGAFLRMLSASRALLLRPHARGRLLAGTAGVLLLATAGWMFCYWMALLPVPAKYRPGSGQYMLMFVMALSFGTQCAISLFIASRSPPWTLGILLIWQLPGLLLHAFGVDDAARLLGGPVSLLMALAAWIAFGIWYLTAPRVHASSWGSRADSAGAAPAARIAPPASREQAMARWVLGGGTPLGAGLLCLCAALVVLAIQWLFARDSGIPSLHALMFGTLSITAVVSGAVSRAMAAHARGLWLSAGRSRLELHAWMERQMLRTALAIIGATVLAGATVWWLVTPRPALPLVYLLGAVVVPGLCAGWLGLMQQHRRSLFDVIAGLAIATGILYGVFVPLYADSAAARWDILGGLLALAVLLREVAWVRWRSADWRRAQRA